MVFRSVSDDRKIANQIHRHCVDEGRRSEATTAQPLRRTLTSRSEVKRGEATRRETKKRHVERMTRLPTKRMATACWDFIVAKRTLRKVAPMLDFSSLQDANRDFNPQIIHICLWMCWGQFCPLCRQTPWSAKSRLDMHSTRGSQSADDGSSLRPHTYMQG